MFLLICKILSSFLLKYSDNYRVKLDSPACVEEKETSNEKARMLHLLSEGLTKLPLKQHEAIKLTILECRGLSIRDVGKTHGIPYSTLRHRSKQGIRRLRKFLERSLGKKEMKSAVNRRSM